MKKLWTITNPLKRQQDTETGSYMSFILNMGWDSDPREIRVTKSLVSLTNKVEHLKEKVAKLDQRIKETAFSE
jgi:hypothetical protein